MNQSAASLGPPVPAGEAVFPTKATIRGRYVHLVPLSEAHAPSLYKHLGGEDNAWRWTCVPLSGFREPEAFAAQIKTWSSGTYGHGYAIMSGPESQASAEAIGTMAYLAVEPAHRKLEVGWLMFGEQLKRSREATEALYLLIKTAFEELGYLRVEWKCHHLNAPSAAAAERLGFQYEGTLRAHIIMKGTRRDSMFFSILADEWPQRRDALEAWLAYENFDADGKQRRRLQDFQSF